MLTVVQIKDDNGKGHMLSVEGRHVLLVHLW